jgi:hypothetical protein
MKKVKCLRIHTQTTAQTNEKAVAAVTDGKIGLGQTVTFEGTHFGMRQRFTVYAFCVFSGPLAELRESWRVTCSSSPAVLPSGVFSGVQ